MLDVGEKGRVAGSVFPIHVGPWWSSLWYLLFYFCYSLALLLSLLKSFLSNFHSPQQTTKMKFLFLCLNSRIVQTPTYNMCYCIVGLKHIVANYFTYSTKKLFEDHLILLLFCSFLVFCLPILHYTAHIDMKVFKVLQQMWKQGRGEGGIKQTIT